MSNSVLSNPNFYFIAVAVVAIFFSMQSIWAQTPSTSSANANQSSDDPLSSCKDSLIKKNIIAFVQKVTDNGNTQYYIPPENRIAVFDNDGTLWSEKPVYFQGFFVFDRVPHVVAKRPEN